MSSHWQWVPSHRKWMPSHRVPVPSYGEWVPPHGEWVPSHGEQVSSYWERVPSHRVWVPSRRSLGTGNGFLRTDFIDLAGARFRFRACCSRSHGRSSDEPGECVAGTTIDLTV